jgi:hypothetical protein
MLTLKRRLHMADREPVNGPPYGTIAREEHDEVWRWYAGKYGTGQDADRIAERGGFGLSEIVSFLGKMPTTWEADSRTPKPRRGRFEGPTSSRAGDAS